MSDNCFEKPLRTRVSEHFHGIVMHEHRFVRYFEKRNLCCEQYFCLFKHDFNFAMLLYTCQNSFTLEGVSQYKWLS